MEDLTTLAPNAWPTANTDTAGFGDAAEFDALCDLESAGAFDDVASNVLSF